MDFFISIFFFFGGGGGLRIQTIFLYILGLFKVKMQNGNIFGHQNFKYFCMPDIPFFIFFYWGGGGGLGVNSRCWVQAYV